MTDEPPWLAAVRGVLTADPKEPPPALPETLAADPAFGKLMFALFVVALEHRFRDGIAYPDVIRFVADVRARSSDPRALDPVIAEHVIMAPVDPSITVDPADVRVGFARTALAKAVISELAPAEADAFFDRALTIAGRLPG